MRWPVLIEMLHFDVAAWAVSADKTGGYKAGESVETTWADSEKGSQRHRQEGKDIPPAPQSSPFPQAFSPTVSLVCACVLRLPHARSPRLLVWRLPRLRTSRGQCSLHQEGRRCSSHDESRRRSIRTPSGTERTAGATTANTMPRRRPATRTQGLGEVLSDCCDCSVVIVISALPH